MQKSFPHISIIILFFFIFVISHSHLHLLFEIEWETAEDFNTGSQSKFQNLNANVNQLWTTDKWTDWQTSSIHKPELLCNLAKNHKLSCLSILSSFVPVCATDITIFLSILVRNLNAALSFGHAEKFPFPSSSLKSRLTVKTAVISGSDIDAGLPDFGTRRKVVAKQYKILATCKEMSKFIEFWCPALPTKLT